MAPYVIRFKFVKYQSILKILSLPESKENRLVFCEVKAYQNSAISGRYVAAVACRGEMLHLLFILS